MSRSDWAPSETREMDWEGKGGGRKVMGDGAGCGGGVVGGWG